MDYYNQGTEFIFVFKNKNGFRISPDLWNWSLRGGVEVPSRTLTWTNKQTISSISASANVNFDLLNIIQSIIMNREFINSTVSSESHQNEMLS